MSVFYFVARYGGLVSVVISCLPVGLQLLHIRRRLTNILQQVGPGYDNILTCMWVLSDS